MKQMISILDENLEYVEQECLFGEDIIYVKSKLTNGICPYCGKMSNRTHSTYDKRYLKFFAGDKEVRVILMNRKLFCDNQMCTHTTFAQRIPEKPDFEERKARFEDAYRRHIKSIGLKVG